MTPATEHLYSTAQAIQAAGITQRQLQYRTDQRTLKPVLIKHSYFYTLDDLVLLRVLRAIWPRSTGGNPLPPKLLRDARRHGIHARYLLVGTQLEKRYGARHYGYPVKNLRLYWAETQEEVLEVSSKAKCGVRLIDVQEIREEIQGGQKARRATA